MGRKSLEDRQRKFQEDHSSVSESSSYVPKKTLKEIAVEECQKAGFDIRTDTSVVYANCKSKEESDKFTAFLLKKFGVESNGMKKIPFSYGFCIYSDYGKRLEEPSYDERDL